MTHTKSSHKLGHQATKKLTHNNHNTSPSPHDHDAHNNNHTKEKEDEDDPIVYAVTPDAVHTGEPPQWHEDDCRGENAGRMDGFPGLFYRCGYCVWVFGRC